MKELDVIYEKLERKHLPFFYEIRFSVCENIVLPHHIKYLLREQVIEDLEQGGGWICKVDNDYAGFCFGVFTDEPIIGGLFVKPEYQSQGIGSQLITYVTTWMFDNGAEKIKLTTDIGSKANFFYKHHGWKYIGLDETGTQSEYLKFKGE